MTVPVTGKTPIFGIEYLVQGEPLRNTRAKMERNAGQIEAALRAGPASPPNTQDLLTVAGRVSTLEGLPSILPTLVAPWAEYNASRSALRVWVEDRTANMVGFLTVASTVGAGDQTLVAVNGLPPAYRPKGWDVSGIGLVSGNSVARVDVNRTGSITATLTASFINQNFLALNMTWPVD